MVVRKNMPRENIDFFGFNPIRGNVKKSLKYKKNSRTIPMFGLSSTSINKTKSNNIPMFGLSSMPINNLNSKFIPAFGPSIWPVARPYMKNHKHSPLASSIVIPRRPQVSMFAPVTARPGAAIWGDNDRDRIMNGFDCAPNDRYKQGIGSTLKNAAAAVGRAASNAYAAVTGRSSSGSSSGSSSRTSGGSSSRTSGGSSNPFNSSGSSSPFNSSGSSGSSSSGGSSSRKSGGTYESGERGVVGSYESGERGLGGGFTSNNPALNTNPEFPSLDKSSKGGSSGGGFTSNNPALNTNPEFPSSGSGKTLAFGVGSGAFLTNIGGTIAIYDPNAQTAYSASGPQSIASNLITPTPMGNSLKTNNSFATNVLNLIKQPFVSTVSAQSLDTNIDRTKYVFNNDTQKLKYSFIENPPGGTLMNTPPPKDIPPIFLYDPNSNEKTFSLIDKNPLKDGEGDKGFTKGEVDPANNLIVGSNEWKAWMNKMYENLYKDKQENVDGQDGSGGGDVYQDYTYIYNNPAIDNTTVPMNSTAPVPIFGGYVYDNDTGTYSFKQGGEVIGAVEKPQMTLRQQQIDFLKNKAKESERRRFDNRPFFGI